MARYLRDAAIVLLAAPFWLPVAAVAYVATAVAMGFPVFFTQWRAGRGGKPFLLVKFRSMKCGTGPDAGRLGAFGRFMRASSIDELPELFHVLAGKMSLVGPRPLPVAYLPRYSARQARRHEVLPGLTGWAQVNGRNDSTWEDRLERDVWYVEHRSHALDLKILALTVLRVFSAKGISHAGDATMPEFKGGGAR